MIKSTIDRIEDFKVRYGRSTEQTDDRIISGANRMAEELRRILTTTFLAEVRDYNMMRSMTLVFSMAPGYRELYKYYLILQNGLSVNGEIFEMSVRETSQLYEYWCFIKLYEILHTRYPLQSQDIIRVNRRGVTVDLKRGTDSCVSFLNKDTEERYYLSYNPTASKNPTSNQRPDNVLELEKKGSKTNYKYVFDAKYRIETNPEDIHYPDTEPGPLVDDINAMHQYRDSIVFSNPESRFLFEKTMFGAYILFPYDKEDEYRNHRFYKSIASVNIGGLPFLPGATMLVQELLDELISAAPETAFERTTFPLGTEEYFMNVLKE